MSTPQLRIDSQPGRIGIEQQSGHLDIEYGPQQMEIEKTGGEVHLDSPPAILEIDHTPSWEHLGLRKINSLTNYLGNKTQQKIREAINQIVAEGERLAAIERGGDAIVEIAKEKGVFEVEVEFPLLRDFLPEINAEPQPVRLDLRVAEFRVHSNFQYPSTNYNPGYVDVYLEQEPRLRIDVVGSEVDLRA
ncbi:DUF6470 family protein [Fuchsiella alkaliacetigena]|uniref:DUF6470 family protein n=1 Tax=Fuchsiella alkaliacetigena TaxID=957042 RepID=UPI00200B7912|nr:DUF6470 family protein [Fuchsiella alkaliacetigena]MCK8824174.1 DUF6470 family protein [Fuchsiella alkaliacetigena]